MKKTYVARAISKERLTKQGLVSLSDYYFFCQKFTKFITKEDINASTD
jgi:hypothetical protein